MMNPSYNIKQLPAEERPRERLLRHGSEALSSAELIAVVLGSGIKGKSVLTLAHEILAHFGSLRHLLRASIEDLCQVKGLGETKSIQLKASLSLATRMYKEKIPPKHQLTTPLHIYLWIRDLLIYEKKEVLGVLLQDIRGKLIRWEVVSVGTLTQILVHPREVFYPAIHHHAASLILVHNHPSGDPTPSLEDYQITRKLITASGSVGIPINDHLIVSSGGYTSLKESGFFFPKNVEV